MEIALNNKSKIHIVTSIKFVINAKIPYVKHVNQIYLIVFPVDITNIGMKKIVLLNNLMIHSAKKKRIMNI